jgi:hypothetical protein
MNIEPPSAIVAKDTQVLLDNSRGASLVWKQRGIDLRIKMVVFNEGSSWSAKVELSGVGLLSGSKIVKIIPLANGQHLLIGCYGKNSYKRSENIYIDLSELLEDRGEAIRPKDEALCELSAVTNGVMTVSRWASLEIVEGK